MNICGLSVQNESILFLIKKDTDFPPIFSSSVNRMRLTPQPPHLLHEINMLPLADHHEEPGNDENTESRRKMHSDSGSLMTSLKFVGQALPEAKGVSASHSQ